MTDQEATLTVLADFCYDAQGRLIEKVANGTTARYYHDDAGRRQITVGNADLGNLGSNGQRTICVHAGGGGEGCHQVNGP